MRTRERHTLNVLVVDDSALVREVITDVLSQERDIRVVKAANPLIAMRKMKRFRPDVILLDLEMPQMDGLTFLRKIMKEDPIPVVVCSVHAHQGMEAALRALQEGAVDIIAKPNLGVQDFLYESAVMLIDTVRGAAQARVRPRGSMSHPSRGRPTAKAVRPWLHRPTHPVACEKIVAVGTSTGGTETLRSLLQAMPMNAPGIVVVQHMPEAFTAAFAQHLNQTCQIEVKEAGNGDRVARGLAFIAPGNRHTLVCRRGAQYVLEVADGPLVSRHRPSVNVLFRSVAQAAGANAIGVILTGMGDDGAEGLLEMKRAGATTIAQDEATCVVFGMPREAITLGAADQVVPLSRIPELILKEASGAGGDLRPKRREPVGLVQ